MQKNLKYAKVKVSANWARGRKPFIYTQITNNIVKRKYLKSLKNRTKPLTCSKTLSHLKGSPVGHPRLGLHLLLPLAPLLPRHIHLGPTINSFFILFQTVGIFIFVEAREEDWQVWLWRVRINQPLWPCRMIRGQSKLPKTREPVFVKSIWSHRG